MPIDKVAWGDHVTSCDQWALVGIPSETIAYDEGTLITGRTVVIPLEPAEAPAHTGRKAENQFYARIRDLGDIKDIDGMSGGPVFALKKVEDVWRYKVIGIQSGWYPSASIIAACPFVSLGAVLEKCVESVKASIKPCQDQSDCRNKVSGDVGIRESCLKRFLTPLFFLNQMKPEIGVRNRFPPHQGDLALNVPDHSIFPLTHCS